MKVDFAPGQAAPRACFAEPMAPNRSEWAGHPQPRRVHASPAPLMLESTGRRQIKMKLKLLQYALRLWRAVTWPVRMLDHGAEWVEMLLNARIAEAELPKSRPDDVKYVTMRMQSDRAGKFEPGRADG